MSGKGDSRRPEAEPGAFAAGYDAINWGAGHPEEAAGDGRIVASGEAHTRKTDAIRAAARLSALAELAAGSPPVER